MQRIAMVSCLVVAAGLARAEDDAPAPLPPVETGVWDRIRLAALGDPQDLTEPLLPDDVQRRPPAGRMLTS